MSVATRTWPYGTKLKATMHNKHTTNSGKFVLILVDEHDEAHALLQAEDTDLQPGERCVLTFCEGGPTGGYWTAGRT